MGAAYAKDKSENKPRELRVILSYSTSPEMSGDWEDECRVWDNGEVERIIHGNAKWQQQPQVVRLLPVDAKTLKNLVFGIAKVRFKAVKQELVLDAASKSYTAYKSDGKAIPLVGQTDSDLLVSFLRSCLTREAAPMTSIVISTDSGQAASIRFDGGKTPKVEYYLDTIKAKLDGALAEIKEKNDPDAVAKILRDKYGFKVEVRRPEKEKK
jgi:hypothetical protein